jgi:hypothetical protein
MQVGHGQSEGDLIACCATFIAMSVEQRELLMAMHDVECVIDIQRYRTARGGRA